MEKAMAPHSSTLAWKIPWAEGPGRLQSMGSQRVGHDWTTLQRQQRVSPRNASLPSSPPRWILASIKSQHRFPFPTKDPCDDSTQKCVFSSEHTLQCLACIVHWAILLFCHLSNNISWIPVLSSQLDCEWVFWDFYVSTPTQVWTVLRWNMCVFPCFCSM